MNGETLIYAGTNAEGGLSVYRLGASGALSLLDTVLFAPSLTATLSRDIAVGGSPEEAMLLLGVGEGRLISYGLAEDGTFEAMRPPCVGRSRASGWWTGWPIWPMEQGAVCLPCPGVRFTGWGQRPS